jgi:hypothetical protein
LNDDINATFLAMPLVILCSAKHTHPLTAPILGLSEGCVKDFDRKGLNLLKTLLYALKNRS